MYIPNLYDNMQYNCAGAKNKEIDGPQLTVREHCEHRGIIDRTQNKSSGLYFNRSYGCGEGKESASLSPDLITEIVTHSKNLGLVFWEAKSLESTKSGYNIYVESGAAKYIAQLMNYHVEARKHKEREPNVYSLFNEKQFGFLLVDEIIEEYISDPTIKWEKRPSDIIKNKSLLKRIENDIKNFRIKIIIKDLLPTTKFEDLLNIIYTLIDGNPLPPNTVTTGTLLPFTNYIMSKVIIKYDDQQLNLENYEKFMSGNINLIDQKYIRMDELSKLGNVWDISGIQEIDWKVFTNIKNIYEFSDIGITEGEYLDSIIQGVRVKVICNGVLRYHGQNWSKFDDWHSWRSLVCYICENHGRKATNDEKNNPMIFFTKNNMTIKDISGNRHEINRELMSNFTILH